jgi:hypothetical protein
MWLEYREQREGRKDAGELISRASSFSMGEI